MNPHEEHQGKHAFPVWVLGIVLLFAIAGAVFLLPKQQTLLERQLKDKNYERAKKTLSAISPEERARRPDFYANAEIQILTHSTASDEEILRGIMAAATHNLSGITNLLRRIKEPAEKYSFLKDSLQKLPADLKKQVYAQLVSLMLAENKPIDAATIYHDFSRDSADAAVAVRQIELFRGAGQTEQALEFLDRYKTRTRTLPQNLRLVEIGLRREGNQPGEAFDAALAVYEESNPETREEILPLLSQLALESGKGGIVLPLLHNDAQSKPGSMETWERLARFATLAGSNDVAVAARQGIARIQPTNTTNLLQLGQLLEWSSKPEAAFSIYSLAFAAGADPAIPELLRLNVSLFKDLELAPLLAANITRLVSAGYGLEAARLLSASAEYSAAATTYRKLLSPKNPEITLELAALLHNIYEYPQVIELLGTNSSLIATNLLAKEMLGGALSKLGRHNEAFPYLQEVTTASTNLAKFRRFLTLAESLGKVDAILSALTIMTNQSNLVSPEIFRTLAFFQSSLGLRRNALDTFRAGVGKYPNDATLRLQFATGLLDSGDFADAAAVLKSHPALKTDPSIGSAYASALIRAQKYTEADRFLRQEVDLGRSPSLIEAAADLAENMRDYKRAASLYGRLALQNPSDPRHVMNRARMLANLGQPKEAIRLIQPWIKNSVDPQMAKLAAEVYSSAGQHRTAEKFQQMYLASKPGDLPQAWGFLGDIRLSRGDRVNARRAYERGLNEMLQNSDQP